MAGDNAVYYWLLGFQHHTLQVSGGKKPQNSGLTSPCTASTAFKSVHANPRWLSEVSRSGSGVTKWRPLFSQRSAEKRNLSTKFLRRQLATSVSSTFSIPRWTSRSEVSHCTRSKESLPQKKQNWKMCATMYDLARWSFVSRPCVLIRTTSSWHRDPTWLLKMRKAHVFIRAKQSPQLLPARMNDDIFKWETWEWFPLHGRRFIVGSPGWNSVMLRCSRAASPSSWPLAPTGATTSLYAMPIVSLFPLCNTAAWKDRKWPTLPKRRLLWFFTVLT